MKNAAIQLRLVNVEAIANKEGAKKRSSIYFFPAENVSSIALGDTYAEHAKAYKTILDDAKAAAGIDPAVKATFSRKAGCSCGCSPGFIIGGQYGMNYFATYAL